MAERKGPAQADIPAGYHFGSPELTDEEKKRKDPLRAPRLLRNKTAKESVGPSEILNSETLEGYPTTIFHPGRKCNGHFDRAWNFVEDGIPEGYHFERGRLVPKENFVEGETAPPAPPPGETPDQIIGTEEQPSSIPLTGEEAPNG